MSVPGESYEQWLARTAPQDVATPADSRRWDAAVVALLGVFSLWLGGTGRWIGLALVAVLATELVLERVRARQADSTRDPLPGADRVPLQIRGVTLLVTLGLSGWLIAVTGPAAIPMPLLLLALDVKDDRSFLRWAFERLR
jgi:hypothetical protein